MFLILNACHLRGFSYGGRITVVSYTLTQHESVLKPIIAPRLGWDFAHSVVKEEQVDNSRFQALDKARRRTIKSMGRRAKINSRRSSGSLLHTPGSRGSVTKPVWIDPGWQQNLQSLTPEYTSPWPEQMEHLKFLHTLTERRARWGLSPVNCDSILLRFCQLLQANTSKFINSHRSIPFEQQYMFEFNSNYAVELLWNTSKQEVNLETLKSSSTAPTHRNRLLNSVKVDRSLRFVWLIPFFRGSIKWDTTREDTFHCILYASNIIENFHNTFGPNVATDPKKSIIGAAGWARPARLPTLQTRLPRPAWNLIFYPVVNEIITMIIIL